MPALRSLIGCSSFKYHQLPISEVVEPVPFVNQSAAMTAIKGAGVSHWPFFLPRCVNSRAVRAGKVDDQLAAIVAHPQMIALIRQFSALASKFSPLLV